MNHGCNHFGKPTEAEEMRWIFDFCKTKKNCCWESTCLSSVYVWRTTLIDWREVQRFFYDWWWIYSYKAESLTSLSVSWEIRGEPTRQVQQRDLHMQCAGRFSSIDGQHGLWSSWSFDSTVSYPAFWYNKRHKPWEMNIVRTQWG